MFDALTAPLVEVLAQTAVVDNYIYNQLLEERKTEAANLRPAKPTKVYNVIPLPLKPEATMEFPIRLAAGESWM